jgi:hypothetical protein
MNWGYNAKKMLFWPQMKGRFTQMFMHFFAFFAPSR